MNAADRRTQPTNAHMLPDEDMCEWYEQVTQQIARIRRIGKELFEVAECIVIVNDGVQAFPAIGEQPSAALTLCRNLPVPDGAMVVPDTCLDWSMSQQPAVAGVPHVRFYAVHPIRNGEHAVIGSVSLVDYAPRLFPESAQQLLADLAALVERELHLQVVNASQLDLQKKNRSLRRKSLIDPLLGTWNRGAIMRILSIESNRCDKQGIPLSLVVVDLDFFKRINDTHGHPAGDSVLVKVASRLRSCIRPQGALGRYGGEEFLVVLPGACHETAMAVAERMREAVAAQTEIIDGAIHHLTISAGIASTALFPAASTEELISRADVALYAAKDAGRNRVIQAMPEHA